MWPPWKGLSPSCIAVKISNKQKCIPVGCVPPTCYCMGGLCQGGVPPWTETLWRETPLWTETHPPDRPPYGQRRPPDRERDAPLPHHPPHGQTDSCENITFANFVCGWEKDGHRKWLHRFHVYRPPTRPLDPLLLSPSSLVPFSRGSFISG